MKRLNIDFCANFYGADYNVRFVHKCEDVEDLKFAKKVIMDYLDNQISKLESPKGCANNVDG